MAKERYDAALAGGLPAAFWMSRAPPFQWPAHERLRVVQLAIGRVRGARAGGRSRFFSVQKPHTGFAASDLHIDSLREKCVEISDLVRVEAAWSKLFGLTRDKCLHHACDKVL